MKSVTLRPDDDEQAELYLFAVDYLEKRGFRQYEISNFSVPGFESRHNSALLAMRRIYRNRTVGTFVLSRQRFYYGRSMAVL